MTTYAQRFTRSALSVGRARDFVGSLVDASGYADRADDIRVCVSELATNALVHGTPRGREFGVLVAMEDGAVRVEVHDASDASPELRQPTAVDEHGRGLLMVGALADEWGVADRDGAGKVVWASFKAAASWPVG
jgi:anti-sigma regulatory factor (Ser/Thr protein kinase)